MVSLLFDFDYMFRLKSYALSLFDVLIVAA